MLQNTCENSLDIEYTSSIPGRIRIRNAKLKGNSVLCSSLAGNISAAPGILAASANPYTGRILVAYDCKRLKEEEIGGMVESFLSEGRLPRKNVSKVIKADFKNKRLLTPKEFSDGRNVLSREYYEYNYNQMLSGLPVPNIGGTAHAYTAAAIARALHTDIKNGLTPEKASEYAGKYGLNNISARKKQSILSVLMSQFQGFTINLLLLAAGVSALLEHVADAAAILAIIAVEAAIGAWQTYKAEKSLESLKQLAVTTAHVIRGGKHAEIPARFLVPGDIICLEAGNRVPADARLFECTGLETVEASLTGESQPAAKKSCNLANKVIPLGDRKNMVYMGTSVIKGKAKAIITATGMSTEMGRIAGMLDKSGCEKTPLQNDLSKLARVITLGCIGICAVITVTGIMAGQPAVSMLSTGVSLAVGAIPEGLATVLAISLAFGARRMAAKNAIVKNLPSIETLSCTGVICTDKTGTLTRNEMTVREIFIDGGLIKVSGDGYNTRGSLTAESGDINPRKHAGLEKLLMSAALCNNARIIRKGGRDFDIKGDPTEAAFLIAVEKSGIRLKEYKCYKREHEVPFDSKSKKMTTICSDSGGGYFLFTKGAVDTILEKCTAIQRGDSISELREEDTANIISANNSMADDALRVLGFAYKPLDEKPQHYDSPELDDGLVFLGLMGVMDPPREGVAEAIRKCHAAGIKVVMITGDHRNTAAAVARSINLLTPGGTILTGEELDGMDDGELAEAVDRVQVFARTCPEQKLKIVKAFKKKGYVVTMTGDGVNDAPALKEANIGIAMGRAGADVTKDVSSIILIDDDFSTIVKAVEEGRTISRNIKKFLKYVLAGNLAEVTALFLAALAGLPMPLLATQILFYNLVTEGIPALSLGLDPPEKDVMDEGPRDASKSIFDENLKKRIIKKGVVTGLTTFGLFASLLRFTGNAARARTAALANLISCQMFHALRCSTSGTVRNKYLASSIGISAAATLAAIYLPQPGGLLGLSPIGAADWGLVLLSSAITGL